MNLDTRPSADFRALQIVYQPQLQRTYSSFRQKAGPLAPGKRAERERTIGKALEYWDEKRLEELFCDVYATFVTGPAYYFSCVDMAVKSVLEPFHVDVRDEHPPMAARVHVCHGALTSLLTGVVSVGAHCTRHMECACTQTSWREMYKLDFCADALLDCLTDAANQSIERFLPQARRYEEPSAVVNVGQEDSGVMSLEDALNAGSRILLANADHYAQWDRSMLGCLMAEKSDL